jgi:hypothetical protein
MSAPETSGIFPDGLLEHLNSDSPLEVLLRGHLWIEQELVAAISAALRDPEQLEPGGQHLSFPVRVRLAAALGMIRPPEVGGYLALNRLRNRVAHRLGSDIQPSDARDLLNAIGRNARNVYDAVMAEEGREPDWLHSLRFTLAVLYMGLHQERVALLEYLAEKDTGQHGSES